MKTWKKVLIGVLIAILALAFAGAGYAFWYMNSINDAIHSGDSLDSDLTDALYQPSSDEATYTLVLGSDSRVGTVQENLPRYADGNARSDVIMLVRSDVSTKTITLVTIPRDTVVDFNGQNMKINEAFDQGGSAYAIQKVEELTGVKISHFVQIDFQGLVDFIDALGGIDIDVPQTITEKDLLNGGTITVEAGEQTLDGQHALAFARSRDQYDGNQDAVRQSNDRTLVTAIINKVTSLPPTQIPGTVTSLAACISTDMNARDLVQLALDYSGGGVTIYSCTGPNNGSFDEASQLWVIGDDAAGWKALMTVVDAGGDPSTVDLTQYVTVTDTVSADATTADATAAVATTDTTDIADADTGTDDTDNADTGTDDTDNTGTTDDGV